MQRYKMFPKNKIVLTEKLRRLLNALIGLHLLLFIIIIHVLKSAWV